MNNAFAVAAHFAGEWDEARVQRWAATTRARLEAPSVSLGVVFMTPHFFDIAAEVLDVLRLHAQIPLLVGCSSQSLIANGEELENQAGIVLQLLHFPSGIVRGTHFSTSEPERWQSASELHRTTHVQPSETRGWLVFADPFGQDGEAWLRDWNAAYPGIPTIGGLASGVFEQERSQLYLDGGVYEEGIVAVSVGGGVRIECVISQGCTLIGAPWTVTKAERHNILTIGNRPAYHVLVDTFNGLPKDQQSQARGNLFVGFASSEYREEFQRGDFLVRNLLAADPKNGTLAVGALPRTGQTIQFLRRDSQSATEDLSACLTQARSRLRNQLVYGGVLSVCNGRGLRLFGKPNHDAGLVQEQLGPLPTVGCFCNGELGPVGDRNYLHGYTASLGLFVKS